MHSSFLILAAGVAAITLVTTRGDAAPAKLTLAQAGHTDYTILVSQRASPAERYAAAELQKYLGEMTGADFPLVRLPVAGPMILVGRSQGVDQRLPGADWASLGDEGFVIRSVGADLILAGGARRGTLYAVYEFLDRYLGCRWFAPAGYSPECTVVPRRKTLTVPPLDYRHVPVLEYREPFYLEAFDGDWAARNRMNSATARLEERHGGKVVYQGFVHTFNYLVPPDKYFADHPEYFSLINGQRTAERAQLCLTNPEVVRVATETARAWLRGNPRANIISVSQNDWYGACQCPDCAALAEKEGSEAGPLLHFVNQVADNLKDEFPQVAVDTLAYQYTRKPPKTIRPRPNVIVRLCSIECCFSHPLAECDLEANQAFCADARAWAAICDRLYVWDYVTLFANYLVPFPNLESLGPNVRFFVDNHVKGIMEQGAYNATCSPFVEMRGYVTARCLWDPNGDARQAREEFMTAFYGAAAPALNEYLDAQQEKVKRENLHVNIWGRAGAAYLPKEMVEQAEALFDRAEAAVAGDPVRTLRVQKERLSLRYVMLERKDEFGLTGEKLQAMADEFGRVAQACGLTRLGEGGPGWEEWLAGKR
jgi:hypothetical protein